MAHTDGKVMSAGDGRRGPARTGAATPPPRPVRGSRAVRQAKRFARCVCRFGIARGLRVFLGLRRRSGIVSLDLPGVKEPIRLRAATSDVDVFEQVFLLGDYDIRYPADPKLIIDGGANIGLASAFFANRFPSAKIVAVEPEETNFKMLIDNVRGYPNVECLRAGLWNEPTSLRVKDIGLGEWGFITEPNPGRAGIGSVTVGGLLDGSGLPEIDILKLDIEGAEKEVFSRGYQGWIRKVRMLVIELHDRFKPGCSAALDDAVKDLGFRRDRLRENVILTRT